MRAEVVVPATLFTQRRLSDAVNFHRANVVGAAAVAAAVSVPVAAAVAVAATAAGAVAAAGRFSFAKMGLHEHFLEPLGCELLEDGERHPAARLECGSFLLWHRLARQQRIARLWERGHGECLLLQGKELVQGDQTVAVCVELLEDFIEANDGGIDEPGRGDEEGDGPLEERLVHGFEELEAD